MCELTVACTFLYVIHAGVCLELKELKMEIITLVIHAVNERGIRHCAGSIKGP